MSNPSGDQEILAAVNEQARLLVNAELEPHELPLPPGFRCDMSRVGFIRRKWFSAVKEYKKMTGIDVVDLLRRIEAELRNSINAPALHIDRR